jgi:hypothetical protein
MLRRCFRVPLLVILLLLGCHAHTLTTHHAAPVLCATAPHHTLHPFHHALHMLHHALHVFHHTLHLLGLCRHAWTGLGG